MSLVKIEGNASGTGVFTVASPNSNTDRTLTLPDNSGTLFASNSSGWSLTPSGSTLYISYGATNIGKIDSSGNLTVSGNVTAYGTV